MGPARLPKTQKAFDEVLAGKTITQSAKDNGVGYAHLWGLVNAAGFKGGKKQRDRRPLMERFRDAIKIEASTGCWLWVGRDPRSYCMPGKGPRTERNVARFVAGLPTETKPSHLRSACGNLKCINPDHAYSGRFQKRNDEIIAKWRESEAAKKQILTLEDLGKEFGLTRERVRQIIEHAEEDIHGKGN